MRQTSQKAGGSIGNGACRHLEAPGACPAWREERRALWLGCSEGKKTIPWWGERRLGMAWVNKTIRPKEILRAESGEKKKDPKTDIGVFQILEWEENKQAKITDEEHWLQRRKYKTVWEQRAMEEMIQEGVTNYDQDGWDNTNRTGKVSLHRKTS